MGVGAGTFWWAEPIRVVWTTNVWVALVVTSLFATALAFSVQTWAQRWSSPHPHGAYFFDGTRFRLGHIPSTGRRGAFPAGDAGSASDSVGHFVGGIETPVGSAGATRNWNLETRN